MSRDVRGCAAANEPIAGEAGGAKRKRPFRAAFALSAASDGYCPMVLVRIGADGFLSGSLIYWPEIF
ncbi:hypothetical protein DXT74_07185 [Chromobacterium sp. Rain0013]|nr:hypothetical protein DXT74_07185 [Chromobacterium sp. Rain0013]